MDKLITENDYLLQKFPGKGGWTYAAIPELKQDKKAPFGWIKVKGFIDNFELKNYKLMPMGNDALFLPVKAAIRKKIGKEAGDMVRVKIYIDEGHFETPEEIQLCLDNESKIVQKNFSRLTEGEQKTWIDWIYEAKKDETKVDRIVCFMKSLEEGKRFIEKEIIKKV